MTVTFIDLSDGQNDRTFTLRGDLPGAHDGRHLNNFIAKHGLHIVAIYQVDKPSLKEAQEWLHFCLGAE